MMRVAVVDYGSGNLRSASKALVEAADRAGISVCVDVTDDPAIMRRAERIVLPGQGAFHDCVTGLRARAGLYEAITDATQAGAPFLGICVGMQLMAQRGLEHHITPGFGWIAGEIAPMDTGDLPLPHMGWNSLDFTPQSHPLLKNLQPGDHAYFVHSYALRDFEPGTVIATTDYAGPRVAMVAKANRAGTQFHVEKSQEVGLTLMENFLRWMP